jgi:hypothetical protein
MKHHDFQQLAPIPDTSLLSFVVSNNLIPEPVRPDSHIQWPEGGLIPIPKLWARRLLCVSLHLDFFSSCFRSEPRPRGSPSGGVVASHTVTIKRATLYAGLSGPKRSERLDREPNGSTMWSGDNRCRSWRLITGRMIYSQVVLLSYSNCCKAYIFKGL